MSEFRVSKVPFIACIPLLVSRQASIGTAFVIWKAMNSAGTTILEVTGGAIQDLTPTGISQYNNVFYLMIAMKAVDVCYGMIQSPHLYSHYLSTFS